MRSGWMGFGLAAGGLSLACACGGGGSTAGDAGTGGVDGGADAGAGSWDADAAGDGARDATPDRGADATIGPEPPPGDRRFYVLSAIDVGAPDAEHPGVVPGFNVDGRVSEAGDVETCRKADYRSGPPDDVEGVDNQLGPVLAENEGQLHFREALTYNVQAGGVLILLEVLGVDDLVDDDLVELRAYLGRLTAGTAAPDLDAEGHLAPGQTFDLDPLSFDASGNPYVRLTGVIEDGRLKVGPGEFHARIPGAVGGVTEITMHESELRADITDEALELGVLGGGLAIDETLEAFRTGEPAYDSLARIVLESSADLDRDGPRCKGISVGLVFEGVEAVRGVTLGAGADAGVADAGAGVMDAGSTDGGGDV